MHQMIKRTIRSVLFAAAALVFAGCNGQSFDYVNQNEIPPGPGVFSGEKGEWTVYDSEAPKEETAVDNAKDASNTDPAAATVPPETADDSEYREFKQFQQWKKEQQDFEAFLEWKKSSQGTGEYQEFKQWQQWKAYREWLDSQKKTE